MTWGIQRGAGFDGDGCLRRHRRPVPRNRLRRRRGAGRRAARVRAARSATAPTAPRTSPRACTATLRRKGRFGTARPPCSSSTSSTSPTASASPTARRRRGPRAARSRSSSSTATTTRSGSRSARSSRTAGGVRTLVAPLQRRTSSRAHDAASSERCTPRAACRPWHPPFRSPTRRPPTACCRHRLPTAPPTATSASTCTCRSAGCAAATATSTPTRPTSCAARKQSDYADQAIAEIRMSRAACSRHPALPAAPASTVFFGGGTPTLLPADRPRARCSAPSATQLGPRTGRRGHDRGEPRLGRRRRPRARSPTAGFTRVLFGMQSAVPHVLADTRAHARSRADPARRRAGRATPGLEVSLDLIYGTPGETLADWRRIARARDRAAARSRQRLRAHRRGRHQARPPDRARRGAAARRRPRRPTCTSSPTTLLAAAGYDWYEVSNWATRRPRTGHATTSRYWTRRGLVGHRPGSAQPRRRRALVERQAPGRLRRAGRRRGLAGRRPRDARRADPRDRDGAARHPHLRRASDLDALHAGGRHAVAGLIADGLVDGRAALAGGVLTLTRRGRLLADAVVRRLL